LVEVGPAAKDKKTDTIFTDGQPGTPPPKKKKKKACKPPPPLPKL